MHGWQPSGLYLYLFQVALAAAEASEPITAGAEQFGVSKRELSTTELPISSTSPVDITLPLA